MARYEAVCQHPQLLLQCAGRLASGKGQGLDEMLFFAGEAAADATSTFQAPIHDRAGRPAGFLLVEVRRISPN